MTMCGPCLGQNARYVGMTGLYGLGLGAADSDSAAPSYDLKRDLIAAGTAFALPALYHYKAPKKWKRPGRLGSILAVAGVYFVTSFAYGKVMQP